MQLLQPKQRGIAHPYACHACPLAALAVLRPEASVIAANRPRLGTCNPHLPAKLPPKHATTNVYQ
jgi:hypothetical protein